MKYSQVDACHWLHFHDSLSQNKTHISKMSTKYDYDLHCNSRRISSGHQWILYFSVITGKIFRFLYKNVTHHYYPIRHVCWWINANKVRKTSKHILMKNHLMGASKTFSHNWEVFWNVDIYISSFSLPYLGFAIRGGMEKQLVRQLNFLRWTLECCINVFIHGTEQSGLLHLFNLNILV